MSSKMKAKANAKAKMNKPAVKESAMKKSAAKKPAPKLRAPADWRAALLGRLRRVIAAAAPGAVEERKWRKPSNPAGVPTWSQDGIICTGETYKSHVKLTFARGAALADPAKLFNSGFDGNVRRAIDFKEGDAVDEPALAALVREAAALNGSAKS